MQSSFLLGLTGVRAAEPKRLPMKRIADSRIGSTCRLYLLKLVMLCYLRCPGLGLDFPHFDHTDGLDASGNFISAAD